MRGSAPAPLGGAVSVSPLRPGTSVSRLLYLLGPRRGTQGSNVNVAQGLEEIA